MDIRKRLKEEADEKYQNFSASLIPNINNVLGVRVPVLRKIAKEIYKTGEYEIFLNVPAEYMEENLVKGFVIGLIKLPAEEILPLVRSFIKFIDNWAVCDGFCCSLKIIKNNLELFWDFVQPYLKSEKEFELRFGYVILLNYYLTDKYIDRVLFAVDNFSGDGYYAKTAVAWLLSACYVKYPQKTEEYLKNSNLDTQTYNKSIQKILESYKVEKNEKNKLKKLKK